MAGQVYFGTKEHMQWVPAPAVNMGAGKSGYAGRADFLNGGVDIRRSKGAAKTYNMAWNLQHREDIQPVLDYADGMYGDGPIYFLDPFGADRNALPAAWAAPYINAYDGPVVVGDTRPSVLNTGSSFMGFPIESAIYTLGQGTVSQSVYIPIPDTYVGYLIAFGQQVSGAPAVNITLHTTPEGGQSNDLILANKNEVNTTSNSLVVIPGSTVRGVSIRLKGPNTGTGVLQLDGMMLQVLPAGAVRSVDRFISGQGASGLSFVNQPAVTAYSAALDRIGVSAELVETEAWKWQ